MSEQVVTSVQFTQVSCVLFPALHFWSDFSCVQMNVVPRSTGNTNIRGFPFFFIHAKWNIFDNMVVKVSNKGLKRLPNFSRICDWISRICE